MVAALAGIVWLDRLAGRPLVLAGVGLLFTFAASLEFLRLFSVRTRMVLFLAPAVVVPGIVAPAFCDCVPFESILMWTFVFLGAVTLLHITGVLQSKGEEAARICLRDHAVGFMATLYCLVPMGLLVTMGADSGHGSLFVVVLILLVKCADIGGFLGGTAFGRRRILPAVSPKKSYEGSLCGLILTIAAGFAVARLWPGMFIDNSALSIVLFAVAINLASQAGDFAESALKRIIGVKDSAQLLPTFGGTLDMMDSLVIAIPVAAFALKIWN